MLYKSSESLGQMQERAVYVTPAAQANGYHQLMLGGCDSKLTAQSFQTALPNA
jgi:hypothetical protein